MPAILSRGIQQSFVLIGSKLHELPLRIFLVDKRCFAYIYSRKFHRFHIFSRNKQLLVFQPLVLYFESGRFPTYEWVQIDLQPLHLYFSVYVQFYYISQSAATSEATAGEIPATFMVFSVHPTRATLFIDTINWTSISLHTSASLLAHRVEMYLPGFQEFYVTMIRACNGIAVLNHHVAWTMGARKLRLTYDYARNDE